MLLLLSVVIVLLALTCFLTRGLTSKVKVWVRAFVTVLLLGPTAYLVLNVRDEASPGSVEVTAEDMQKALPAVPK
ncbi:hypothetical protein EYS42_16920 [Aquabacterium lacunae]|uniref:Uncharacterized protein n=1 Tax=Aquabacterium lacunae TaxID=2528630 RepID=A0A4Q9GZG3_9BURK|nr:hypothetical protein [Aquabacterium lacunae]TBO27219.1 hypothetical protein EYS42_16920 [Aquabacterium lacunae]